MNRGDIWFIDPGGKSGKRPVVIVTRQNVIEHLNKVAVVEITTKGKPLQAVTIKDLHI